MSSLTTARSPRLLDRLRAACRVRHYSLRTEDCYVHWVRRYILFHDKRHPQELGEPEVNRFLTYLGLGEHAESGAGGVVVSV
jgi:hypothetical protein